MRLFCKVTAFSLVICVFVLLTIRAEAQSAIRKANTVKQLSDPLTDSLRFLQQSMLADHCDAKQHGKTLEEAGVALGTWWRIGPFRDQGPLINWMVNVRSSFAFEFKVAKDTKANGNVPLLNKTYPAPFFILSITSINNVRSIHHKSQFVNYDSGLSNFCISLLPNLAIIL